MPNNCMSILQPAGSGDPYNGNVVLRAIFNGANGTNNFSGTDDKNHAFTSQGSPIYSSAQSSFGGSSLYCDGSSGLIVPGTGLADFQFGTADFTQEGLMYLTAYTSVATIVGNGNGSGDTGLVLYVNALGALVLSTGSHIQGKSANGAVPLNQWCHLSHSRIGLTAYLHVNGVLVASFPANINVQDGVMNFGYQPAAYYTNGYIQQVRVTKGVGRYNGANYTPILQSFRN